MEDDGLREKVARECEMGQRAQAWGDRDPWRNTADRILALPEIAEALRINLLVKMGAVVDKHTRV